ncbi:MAG: indole-3-glycerol phosphate synthase [Planctomycetota bacterium]|jgi:indole-3-glycerol phosphate synthase
MTQQQAWREEVAAEARRRRAVQDPERLRDLVHVDSWRRERFLAATQAPRILALRLFRKARWSPATLAEAPRPGQHAPARSSRTGPRWHAWLDDARAHARVVFVGTDPARDDGALEDLRAAEFARLHRVRDGAILDEDMLLEGFLYGADSVLLEAGLLEDAALSHLRGFAREYGSACFVRARDARELARALACEPEAVVLEALDPFGGALDAELHEALLPTIPRGVVAFAAGGMDDAARRRRAFELGARGVVLGDRLDAAIDWASALRDATP